MIFKNERSLLATSPIMEFTLALILAVSAVVQGASVPPKLTSFNTTDSEKGGLGVYHGQETTIEKHPYIVNVVTYNGSINCSGTILNENYILTLADCVSGLDPSDVYVVAASDDGNIGKKYNVLKIVVHPEYKSYDNNVAVLKVSKFTWSDKIKPVDLPDADPKPQTKLEVAGYGSTSSDFTGRLHEGVMKWYPRNACKKLYEQYITFTRSMGCTYNKHKTTLCWGDWAAAFVRDGKVYAIFQAGLSADFCSENAEPLLTTAISVVADWIKKVINQK